MRFGTRHFFAIAPLLLLLAGCSSASMAPLPRYTTSVLLLPPAHIQQRRIQFPPNSMECWAIAHVRTDLKNVRCYDVLTLQLGPVHHHHGWTEGYAAIRQCVARLTPAQLRGGCARSIRLCATGNEQGCAPEWTAQTAIGFRTDGKHVIKEWITCGAVTTHRFTYHLHWCGTAKGLPPHQLHWLSAGDDYELDIPGVVEVGTEERISLRPDGALLFRNCC